MKRLHTITQRPARATWRGSQLLLENAGLALVLALVHLLNYLSSNTYSITSSIRSIDTGRNFCRYQLLGYLGSQIWIRTMMGAVAKIMTVVEIMTVAQSKTVSEFLSQIHFAVQECVALQHDGQQFDCRVDQPEHINPDHRYRSGRCRFSLAPM
jgi:hypothetical protein